MQFQKCHFERRQLLGRSQTVQNGSFPYILQIWQIRQTERSMVEFQTIERHTELQKVFHAWSRQRQRGRHWLSAAQHDYFPELASRDLTTELTCATVRWCARARQRGCREADSYPFTQYHYKRELFHVRRKTRAQLLAADRCECIYIYHVIGPLKNNNQP